MPLADEYPNLLEFLTSNVGGSVVTSTPAGGAVRWADVTTHFGNLSPGQSATVTVGFTAVAAGSVTNMATVAGATDEGGRPVPTANATNRTLVVTGPPRAELLKSANPRAGDVVMPGDLIRYRLSFENTTTVPMPAVIIADTMPEAVSYVSGTTRLELDGPQVSLTDADDADAGTWNASSKSLSVAVGTLAPGARGSVTFDARVRDSSISRPGVFNHFTLASANATPQVSNETVHPVDPFDITKTARDLNGGKLKAGDVILWTIRVRNTGLIPTTYVVVTDKLPTGVTYVPGSITGRGADDSNDRKLVWNVGTIPVDGEVTLTFRSTVDSGLRKGTVIRNQATVDSAETRPKSSDNPGTSAFGDPTLVRTGDNDWIWVSLVAALLGLGIALIAWGGWRRIAAMFSGFRVSARALAVSLGITLVVAALVLASAANIDEISYRLGMMDAGVSFDASQPTGDGIAAARQKDLSASAGSQARGNRVIIPRLGIDIPVGEEELSALRRGAWHHAGSADPGEKGNVVLAGHRRNGIFSLLHNLEPGDVIFVRWDGKDHEYRVASSRVVLPTATGVIARAGRDRLTLYTCIPRYLGNKRTLITAYPVQAAAQADATEAMQPETAGGL